MPCVGMILVNCKKAQGEESNAVLGPVVFHKVHGGVLGYCIDRVVSGKREVARGFVRND